jgi:hypothetical protein
MAVQNEIIGALHTEPTALFSKIAKDFGVTRERVRQIALAIGQTAKTRNPLRTAAKREVNRTTPPEERTQRWIWSKLLDAGMSVRRDLLPCGKPNWNTLMVNGLRCRMRTASSTFSPSRSYRKYIRFVGRDAGTCDYGIYVYVSGREKRRVFIIPAFLLDRNTIYIPTQEHETYRNIKPETDWLQFEGRWDLLAGEEARAA